MASGAVKPSTYDLEFSDVNYIVERYQQRAFEVDPGAGVFASYQNIVESSRQVLNMAVNTLLIFNEAETTDSPVVGDVQTLSGAVPCSDVEFPPEVEDDVDLKVNLNKLWEEFAPIDEEIANASSQDDIEECIPCDFREFGADWEFKPVFALDGLRDMIDNINNSIDDLLKQLDPYNLLNGLCPFLGDFNKNACMFDLKALLGLIGLLMKRYSMASMDLVLNWSLLLGPIIKGAVDAIATLIEEVLQWVSYIFVCFRNYLNFARKIISESQALIVEAANLADRVSTDSIQQMIQPSNYRPSTFNLGPNYSNNDGMGGLASASKDAAIDTFGDWAGEGRSSAWSNPPTATEYFNAQGERPKTESYNFRLPAFNSSPTRMEGLNPLKKGGGIPTSFNLGYKPTMENMFGINKPLSQQDNVLQKGIQGAANAVGGVNTHFLDRLMAAINSAENYIKELFGSLLFSIKSLNNMISQNFNTSIKLGGMILALIDLTQILIAVSKLDKGKNLCDDLEAGVFDDFENFLKSLYGLDELDISIDENGRATIDSGIYDLNVLKHCNAPDVDPGRVGTLFVDEEDRNRNSSEPWNNWNWEFDKL